MLRHSKSWKPGHTNARSRRHSLTTPRTVERTSRKLLHLQPSGVDVLQHSRQPRLICLLHFGPLDGYLCRWQGEGWLLSMPVLVRCTPGPIVQELRYRLENLTIRVLRGLDVRRVVADIEGSCPRVRKRNRRGGNASEAKGFSRLERAGNVKRVNAFHDAFMRSSLRWEHQGCRRRSLSLRSGVWR